MTEPAIATVTPQRRIDPDVTAVVDRYVEAVLTDRGGPMHARTAGLLDNYLEDLCDSRRLRDRLRSDAHERIEHAHLNGEDDPTESLCAQYREMADDLRTFHADIVTFYATDGEGTTPAGRVHDG